MTRLVGVSLMLVFLSACATQAQIESSIDINAIEAGNVALLETYKDNSYITTSKQARPSYIEFSNAMESAIYNRNIKAVRYLISINAANKVSVRFQDHRPQWARTPVNVPAAELACGVAEFEIMTLLQESYPEDKPNYTNCLHYLVASYNYYPTGHFFTLNNPVPQWRNGENTALAVEKIIALGGEPNTMPDYGVSMYEMVLTSKTNNLLKVLLENGMDPNTEYACFNGKGSCTFLSDLSVYEDEQLTSERANLLVQYGANVNTVQQTLVASGYDSYGSTQFKEQNMTALHMAKYYDRGQLSETLIQLGADPTLTNNDGKTAESYAGSYAQIKAQQAAANQQATTANANQDSGGSGLGTLMNIIGAVGAGAW